MNTGMPDDLTLFGVKLARHCKIGHGFSNQCQRWEFHNLIMENVTDEEVANFEWQMRSSPVGVYLIDALQFFNNQTITDFPSPKTQLPLSGGETEVSIEFPTNITSTHVKGFEDKFFTFSGHKKLYWLTKLDVEVGARTGKMTFSPNAHYEVSAGETINCINPNMQVVIPYGKQPLIQRFSKDNWRIAADFDEYWTA